MHLGVDSFVSAVTDPSSGRVIGPEERMEHLLEEIALADRVGLHSFGIGEHHRSEYYDSAPPVILARLEVDYRRQLFYRPGEQVQVQSWVTRLGTSSITTRQDLHQDDQVAISVVAVLVVVDGDAPRPLTADERAWWTTFLEPPAG